MKAHYESFESNFGKQHRIVLSGGSSGQYLMDFNNARLFQASFESAIQSCSVAIEREKEELERKAAQQSN